MTECKDLITQTYCFNQPNTKNVQKKKIEIIYYLFKGERDSELQKFIFNVQKLSNTS